MNHNPRVADPDYRSVVAAIGSELRAFYEPDINSNSVLPIYFRDLLKKLRAEGKLADR